MQIRKIKSISVTVFSLLLTVIFCSTSLAAISGTDSKGSYSYGESKFALLYAEGKFAHAALRQRELLF